MKAGRSWQSVTNCYECVTKLYEHSELEKDKEIKNSFRGDQIWNPSGLWNRPTSGSATDPNVTRNKLMGKETAS